MKVREPLIVAAVVGVVAVALTVTAVRTAPVRGSVRAYTELLGAANRQDVEAARRACTSRYARTHPLRPAPDGGIVGLPRNIHKNFQAWREGPHVWLCPTNRVGPVYQFVHESGAWRFDGPVGLLVPGGRVARFVDAETTEPDATPSGGG